MPVQSNNVLDDPILLDGNDSFVGGQVSSTRANLVPDNAYADGKNIDLDEFGNAVTRRGASLTTGYLVWETTETNWEAQGQLWNGLTAPIKGVAYFDTGAAERLVLSDGGTTLKTSTESGDFTVITGSSIAAGATVEFAQLVNRLYYADGDGALRYLDSSAANQTITANKVTSIEITEKGLGYTSVPTITFTGSNTTPAAATAVLGYGGKVVSATVDTAGSGYSTTAPPTIAFTAAPTGGTDAKGVVHLSQTPLKPKLLVSANSRLFATSADASIPDDTIYVSDILDGESWDLIGNSIRVGGGDGDPIVALTPWYGYNMLVFKELSIWVIEADPSLSVADWTIKLINNRTGCVAARTVQQVGSDVLFLSRDGVRSIKTIEAGAQTDVSLPVSTPVNDLIGRINQAQISKCCAVYWRNRYLLSVPLDSATTPDRVLCYHLLAKSWTGHWSGWEPRDWVITAFGGKLRMNFGDQRGQLYTWDDYTAEDSTTADTYKDGATAYESYIKSRAYRYGETWGDKIGYSVQFNLENIHSTAITSNLYYYKDLSDSAQTLASSVSLTADTNLIREGYNLLPKGRFNQIQFKVQADEGRLALHSIETSAFGQPIKPER
jgi:hypothetical protein|tara:strand:+ start:333 stop:2159 length:1827 start_codon:yes stop_codon:yes gene_type:complete